MDLTAAEIVAGLVALDVPRDRAEMAAMQYAVTLAEGRPSRSAPRPATIAPVADVCDPAAIAPGHSGPQRTITFPWALVVSDNLRRSHLAGRDKWRAYRDGRDAMHAEALRQCRGTALLDGPLALAARVYPPDRRRRDIVNLAKACQDALTGVVYVDDVQLQRVTWERRRVDREHPRVVLTLTPLAP